MQLNKSIYICLEDSCNTHAKKQLYYDKSELQKTHQRILLEDSLKQFLVHAEKQQKTDTIQQETQENLGVNEHFTKLQSDSLLVTLRHLSSKISNIIENLEKESKYWNLEAIKSQKIYELQQAKQTAQNMLNTINKQQSLTKQQQIFKTISKIVEVKNTDQQKTNINQPKKQRLVIKRNPNREKNIFKNVDHVLNQLNESLGDALKCLDSANEKLNNTNKNNLFQDSTSSVINSDDNNNLNNECITISSSNEQNSSQSVQYQGYKEAPLSEMAYTITNTSDASIVNIRSNSRQQLKNQNSTQRKSQIQQNRNKQMAKQPPVTKKIHKTNGQVTKSLNNDASNASGLICKTGQNKKLKQEQNIDNKLKNQQRDNQNISQKQQNPITTNKRYNNFNFFSSGDDEDESSSMEKNNSIQISQNNISSKQNNEQQFQENNQDKQKQRAQIIKQSNFCKPTQDLNIFKNHIENLSEIINPEQQYFIDQYRCKSCNVQLFVDQKFLQKYSNSLQSIIKYDQYCNQCKEEQQCEFCNEEFLYFDSNDVVGCKICTRFFHKSCIKKQSIAVLDNQNSFFCQQCKSCAICKKLTVILLPQMIKYKNQTLSSIELFKTNINYMRMGKTICNSCIGKCESSFKDYDVCQECCIPSQYDLDTMKYIGCDECQKWFHIKCIGMTQEQYDQLGKNSNFQCLKCEIMEIYNNKLSKQ